MTWLRVERGRERDREGEGKKKGEKWKGTTVLLAMEWIFHHEKMWCASAYVQNEWMIIKMRASVYRAAPQPSSNALL